MNYPKLQILAFTGHRDKYVKALAAQCDSNLNFDGIGTPPLW